MFFWLTMVKYYGDRFFTHFRRYYGSLLLQQLPYFNFYILQARSCCVLPCLFEICISFPGGLRQVYVICNLSAVIQLTRHLCCGLISAQTFTSWQTKHMPQFCFWERSPGSGVLGTMSFIISIGNSLNPCSAVSSAALVHIFAFIFIYKILSFISVMKLYKQVLLFSCVGFLHFCIFISSAWQC